MKTYQGQNRYFAACTAAVFTVAAGVMFILQYGKGNAIPSVFDADVRKNTFLFFANFFIPFVITAAALFVFLFYNVWFIRLAAYIAGIFTVIMAGYTIPDLFTIKLCMYIPYIIACAVIPRPQNIAYSVITVIGFSVFLFHPDFMGTANISLKQYNPSPAEFAGFHLISITLWSAILFSRYFACKCDNLKNTVSHLNITENQLLTVNHQLQENAKERGEKASKEERARITRDMHDSCGYVFTNIIALSDAAISTPEIGTSYAQRMFQLIRTQAADGLQRTRETLYLIREIQEPVSTGIQDIYQLKRIFEEATGINVDIETGNMEHQYGRAVNLTLRKIVQEAFTNSIRHGHATRILLHFWEFPGELTITVTDNGIGAKNIVKGIGLAGMEERLHAIGGSLSVSSPADGGFRLAISLPLTGMETRRPAGKRRA